MDIGDISGSSEMIQAIARDSTKKYLGYRDNDPWPAFKRTRFQDYANYLRPLDPIWQDKAEIELIRYPKILHNTIAEENARRQIFKHLKNIQLETTLLRNSTLKGMITGIDYSNDSLRINLIPFFFSSQLPFDSCHCGQFTLPSKQNPFYYSGSLKNWICTYKHPKDKEIQTYNLKPIE